MIPLKLRLKKMTPEEVARSNEIFDYAHANLNAVIPIYKMAGNNPTPIGSGVILKKGNHTYVLTAAHVLDECGPGEVAFTPGEKSIIWLNGGYHKSPLLHQVTLTPITRKDDTVDVGIIRLDDEAASELRVEKHCIQMDDIKPIRLHLPMFLHVGYPAKYFHKDSKQKTCEHGLLTTGGIPITDQKRQELGYEPFNLVSRYNHKYNYSTIHGSGCTAPMLHGMSGGGIFEWIPNEETEKLEPTLIGILHVHDRKKRILVGTIMEFYQLLMNEVEQRSRS